MTRLSYVLSVLTVALSRFSLHILEANDVHRYAYVAGIRWHHFYTGALLVGLGFLFPRQNKIRPALFGLGAGFLIDESFLPLNFYHFYQFTYWYWGSWLIMLTCLTVFLYVGWKDLKK